ncbi:MAG: hypothetical protein ACREDS_06805 [Limisphaerales bacterium]
MTRQNVGQNNGKCFTAAAAMPAIGTKYTPTSAQSSVRLVGIVALKKAVPV